MTTVSYSTMEVVPVVKNLARELERQTSGGLTQAGRTAGRKYGDVAGREAGGRFRSQFQSQMKGITAPLAGIAVGAGLVSFFRDSFAEAKEAGEVTRVTAKLIETTGQAANVTAGQVGSLSEKMMEYAAVDDEMVQAGANVLLTFKKIQNAAGEGNDVFDRSIKAALDLSTVLKTDLSSGALQLGKALNDPIKGVTSLGRAGVQFTADQKAMIKALVESGDILSAQKLILSEVEGQVGGAAGAAADGADRLGVAFGNLAESFGTEIMPAMEAFSKWATADGIPALSAAGGATKDLITTFAGLPKPVLAGAAAFGVLKIAAATSLGTTAVAGVSTLASGMTGLRIRAMLAADAFQVARAGSLSMAGGMTGAALGAGRLSASLAGVQAASVGAGASLRGGLGRSLALVGGPWGAAFIAGTILLTKFYTAHKEAEQRADALTDSLDRETGAITAQTRELVKKALEEDGTLERAQLMGLSLQRVTDAALGNADALEFLNAEVKRSIAVDVETGRGTAVRTNGLYAVRDAVKDQSAAVRDAIEVGERSAQADGKGADAKGQVISAMRDYATEIDKARSALDKLIDRENKRKLTALQSKRDQLALITTLQAAREEANKGKQTLDKYTDAGKANWAALLDVADQWNTSTPKVQNARGAYEKLREQFIKLADDMGKSRKGAERLADKILGLPRSREIAVSVPGGKDALQTILDIERASRRAARVAIHVGMDANLNRHRQPPAFAQGGKVGGAGTGDNQLIWADPREHVMRPAAVAHYGDDFMRRLNAMQLPRFAEGGPVGTAPQAAPRPAAPGAPQINFTGDNYFQDGRDMLRRAQRATRSAGLDGVQQ